MLERLLDAGPVRLVTLAPELPGALELIDLLLARGVAVSCGHTDATAEEAEAAFDRGALAVTHLFNAMRPFRHRDPGIAGAALVRDDVVIQLILDGHHVADETALLVWRAAAGRLALVTDAMAGAGQGDGSYRLGDVEVEVRDGSARSSQDVLAGSVLTMLQAVRNLHALGVPLADALSAATVGARAGRGRARGRADRARCARRRRRARRQPRGRPRARRGRGACRCLSCCPRSRRARRCSTRSASSRRRCGACSRTRPSSPTSPRRSPARTARS